MKSLHQLREDKARYIEKADAILKLAESQNRSFTKNESMVFNNLLRAAEEATGGIEVQERSGGKPNQPHIPGDAKAPIMTDSSARFNSFGEQLLAIRQAAFYPSEADQRLHLIHKRATVFNASNEAIPSTGGFLVAPEFSANLLLRAYMTGAFLGKVTKIPIKKPGSNALRVPAFDEQSRANGSRFGGVQTAWLSQDGSVTTDGNGNVVIDSAALTSSKPKFRAIEMTAEKLTGLCYITDELLEDVATLETVMMTAFGQEFSFVVERACAFGTGQGQPLGFMNGSSLITVSKESGQASATLVSQNVIKMFSRMWAPSRNSAAWFINSELETQMLQMSAVVGDGGSAFPYYVPTRDPENQPYNLLLGRPVIPVEWASPVGTAGDIIFADPSGYLLTERNGILGMLSLEIKFLTNEGAFRFTWRVNGQPIWHQPLTPLNGTNTVSPFVTLQAGRKDHMTKTQRNTLIAILNGLAAELHGDTKSHMLSQIAALREDLESGDGERSDAKKA